MAMNTASHPSRRYSIDPSSTMERSLEASAGAMDYEQANVESFGAASKNVADMLTKPDALDTLEQTRLKVARKKATIESQLRNAVQTQLEGVESGLEGLKLATDVVKDIKERMHQVEEVYKQCEELADIISPLREVTRRYQQLRTTNVHINNIFGVPDTVEEIQTLIENGELLQAHQLLAELEHTRDELLIQLHQSSDAFVDKNTALHRYFEPLIGLSSALGQQLWIIMDSVTEKVNNDPTSVVTALRIVQREEKADRYIDDNLRERGIPAKQIPNRPKKWKDKCVQIIETSIANKFNELKPYGIEENQDWLDDHLTEVASVSYQDLKSMQSNGVKCFPPDYDILQMYLNLYHRNLKQGLTDLVNMNLNARDIIKLMVWVGDVRQSFREHLNIDLQSYGPLIDEAIEDQLEETCVSQVEWNVSELVKKMVQSEKEDWSATDPPESDNGGAYYTTVGILLYEMIDQNVSALSMLGKSTKERVLTICLEQVLVFQKKYQELVDDTFRAHLAASRRDPPLFFEYMIAVANNCKSCMEFSDRLKKTYSAEVGELTSKIIELFRQIGEIYDAIGTHCCDILIAIMFEDLTPVLDGLMTKDYWLNKPIDLIDKVEGTIMDYNSDFTHLKPAYHSYTIVQTQQKVIKAYFESMMKKKVVLKKKDDRQKAASFIREESKKIGNLFNRLSHATNPKYIQVLDQFAELLASSLDTVPFIIGGLSTRYPEVKFHHVVAVLAMRGDLNKASCQKLMDRTPLTQETADAQPERSTSPTYSKGKLREEKSILSLISVHNPYSLF